MDGEEAVDGASVPHTGTASAVGTPAVGGEGGGGGVSGGVSGGGEGEGEQRIYTSLLNSLLERSAPSAPAGSSAQQQLPELEDLRAANSVFRQLIAGATASRATRLARQQSRSTEFRAFEVQTQAARLAEEAMERERLLRLQVDSQLRQHCEELRATVDSDSDRRLEAATKRAAEAEELAVQRTRELADAKAGAQRQQAEQAQAHQQVLEQQQVDTAQ